MKSYLLNSTVRLALMTGAAFAAAGQARAQALDEVVVTAERRVDRLQNVPLAVSSFSAEQIQARQLSSTYDLIKTVPNFSARKAGGAVETTNTYFVRGVGNPDSIATSDPAVGTYVDEFYIPRQQSSDIQLLDVERIEVLRGPQGTLFGRNTTGGAVNVITKKPNAAAGGALGVSYGAFSELNINGSANIPLSEKVFVKASGFSQNDDGWSRSVVNGQLTNARKSYGGRLAIRFVPTEKLSWDVTGGYVFTDALGVSNPPQTGAAQPLKVSSLVSGDKTKQFSVLRQCHPGGSPIGWFLAGCQDNTISEKSITSNVGYDAGFATINFLTQYRDARQKFALDLFNNSPVGLFRGFVITNDSRHKVFSQEVKITGSAYGERLKYVAGVFYMDEDNTTALQDWFTLSSLTAFDASKYIASGDNRYFKNGTVSKAIYGQLDYKVTGQLTLTVGARYTVEDKDLQFFTRDRATLAIKTTTAAIPGPASFTEEKLTPRFVARYEITPDVSVFASATNGFRSGGWNARATNPAAVTTVHAETVWSYESGLRSEWFQRRLRANVTGFYAETKDRIIDTAFQSGTAFLNISENAGDTRSFGVETELTARITSAVNGFLNVGYQEAKYTRLSARAIAAGYRLSTPLIYTPRFTIAGGIDYTRHIDRLGGEVGFNINADYMPKTRIAVSPTDVTTAYTARTLVNALVSYGRADQGWTVSAGCTNCFDTDYFQAPGGTVAYVGDPARFRMKFSVQR